MLAHLPTNPNPAHPDHSTVERVGPPCPDCCGDWLGQGNTPIITGCPTDGIPVCHRCRATPIGVGLAEALPTLYQISRLVSRWPTALYENYPVRLPVALSAAICDHQPGPIPGVTGWTILRLSRRPAAAGHVTRVTYHGVPVVEVDDGDTAVVLDHGKESAGVLQARYARACKAKAYAGELAQVRALINADPAVQAAAAALYEYTGPAQGLYGAAGYVGQLPEDEPARQAAVALLFAGIAWRPGRMGGVIQRTAHSAGVSLRGALGLPH